MSVKVKRILSVIFFLVIVAGLYHAANVMLFEKQHFGTAKNIAHEEPEKIDVREILSHFFENGKREKEEKGAEKHKRKPLHLERFS